MEIDTFRTHGLLVMGFLHLDFNMNKEDIIAIAREVGFSDDEINTCQLMLERFAALVAAVERDQFIDFAMQAAEVSVDLAIALERESCAKIADEYVGQDLEHNFSALIAHNIRARVQT